MQILLSTASCFAQICLAHFLINQQFSKLVTWNSHDTRPPRHKYIRYYTLLCFSWQELFTSGCDGFLLKILRGKIPLRIDETCIWTVLFDEIIWTALAQVWTILHDKHESFLMWDKLLFYCHVYELNKKDTWCKERNNEEENWSAIREQSGYCTLTTCIRKQGTKHCCIAPQK